MNLNDLKFENLLQGSVTFRYCLCGRQKKKKCDHID